MNSELRTRMRESYKDGAASTQDMTICRKVLHELQGRLRSGYKHGHCFILGSVTLYIFQAPAECF